MITTNRRTFLSLSLAGMANVALARPIADTVGETRTRRGSSVAGLVIPKLERVRFGLIGVGRRGKILLDLLIKVDGADIVALCDTDERALTAGAAALPSASDDDGFDQAPRLYGDSPTAFRDMIQAEQLDAVIIATPWRWHVPMALAAMEAGLQTFVEVPAALNRDECWQLVEAAERHQVNCMMLENICYGREEMMALNMVRADVIGTLLHGEAAYIHDLRWQMKDIDTGTGSWRTEWHSKRNANLYPTHGLGPIAQYMDINRGDRFDYISSMSSAALGRAQYADRELHDANPHKTLEPICGDINTSIIRTVRGRTIMLQYDTTTPRPYTRHNLIQGTNGVFSGYPNRIALENNPLAPETKDGFHDWDQDMADWYKAYDHPIWTKLLDIASEQKDHGGLDFVMLWRIVYCLRNGLPLDQDVYDAAAWSVVIDLSEQSVNNRSRSIDFPDFTRGEWKSRSPLEIRL